MPKHYDPAEELANQHAVMVPDAGPESTKAIAIDPDAPSTEPRVRATELVFDGQIYHLTIDGPLADGAKGTRLLDKVKEAVDQYAGLGARVVIIEVPEGLGLNIRAINMDEATDLVRKSWGLPTKDANPATGEIDETMSSPDDDDQEGLFANHNRFGPPGADDR